MAMPAYRWVDKVDIARRFCTFLPKLLALQEITEHTLRRSHSARSRWRHTPHSAGHLSHIPLTANARLSVFYGYKTATHLASDDDASGDVHFTTRYHTQI